MTRLLIGGYTGDKGAGTGIMVLDGSEIVATIPADSPSWLARHPGLPVLYAVAETDNGRVRAWALDEDGLPAADLGTADTGGSERAHLAVDDTGRYLITANYSGGSLCVHELGPDGRIGRRTDLVQHTAHGDLPRQEQAHPHMARTIPGGVLVTDLGADRIYRYHLSQDGRLTTDAVVAVPPGSGPRHLLPTGDGYYVTAELSGQVLGFDAGWRLRSAVPASRREGPNQPSELVSNGRFLYVANRGPNTVSVFALEGEQPRYVTEVPVGDWPRHLALDGDRLYVASERSHQVSTLLIDPVTGVPAAERTSIVPSPTVILT